MVKQKITESVTKRELTGRKVKQLRNEGILPANIYGKGVKSISVQLPTSKFNNLFETAGETNIIYLTVDGEKKERPTLITNTHTDPLTGDVIHADFRQIDITIAVTATDPVELVGESPADKEKGAIIVQVLNEVDVEALPTDIPDRLELDISPLIEFGDSLSVADLKAPEGVKIQAEAEQQIVQAQEPKEEEEPAPVETEGEEGAEATEGEKAPEAEAAATDVSEEAKSE